jgi:hypothetical protein
VDRYFGFSVFFLPALRIFARFPPCVLDAPSNLALLEGSLAGERRCVSGDSDGVVADRWYAARCPRWAK